MPFIKTSATSSLPRHVIRRLPKFSITMTRSIQIIRCVRRFSRLINPSENITRRSDIFLFTMKRNSYGVRPTFRFTIFVFRVNTSIRHANQRISIKERMIRYPNVALPSILSRTCKGVNERLSIQVILINGRFRPRRLIIFSVRINMRSIIFMWYDRYSKLSDTISVITRVVTYANSAPIMKDPSMTVTRINPNYFRDDFNVVRKYLRFHYNQFNLRSLCLTSDPTFNYFFRTFMITTNVFSLNLYHI